MTGPTSDADGHESDGDPLELLSGEIQDVLSRLYDPTYHPPSMLHDVLGVDRHEGLNGVRQAIISAIETLKPSGDVPPTARIRRIYGILHHRYVEDLTQEDTASRIGITPRHIRRLQPEAARILAGYLWERHQVRTGQRNQVSSITPSEPCEWRSQLRKDLASLQDNAPSVEADVGEVLQQVAQLGSRLAERHQTVLGIAAAPANTRVLLHPAALHEVLIAAIGELLRFVTNGHITLAAQPREECVSVQVTASPATEGSPDIERIQEVVTSQGGEIECTRTGGILTLTLTLPSVCQSVLVIDDNPDIAHLYRRYVVGTPYRILHLAEGHRVFESILANPADAIILDILLPDVNAWELLQDLHQHPNTRSIPVIVSSVIAQQELALALGATGYLPKPVDRAQFITALDRVFTARGRQRRV